MTTKQSVLSAARPYLPWAVFALILGAVFVPNWRLFVGYFEQHPVTPHAPDWTLAARLPPMIKLHVAAALSALLIGGVILFKPKGTGFHRTLGWAWVLGMAAAAISSLFIMELNRGAWSIIHLLSGWTIIGLPMAIYAIRRKQVQTHQRAMTGMFIGGLIVAGVLAFVPGRFMFDFLLG